MRRTLCLVLTALMVLPGVTVSLAAPPEPVLRVSLDNGAPTEGIAMQGVASVPGRTGQAGHFSIADLSHLKVAAGVPDRDQGALSLFVRLQEPSDRRTFRTILNIGGAHGTTVTLREDRMHWLMLSPKLGWGADEWHHLALCWRRNDSDRELPFRYDVAMYVDGAGLVMRTVNRRPVSAGAITLGAYPVPAYGKPQLFELEGDLDEVAAYDRWLSPEEVALVAGLSAEQAVPAPVEKVVVPRRYEGAERLVDWGDADGLRLGKDSPAVIVLAENASDTEKLAAQELAEYVARMTGETIEIVASAPLGHTGGSIIVGNHTAAEIGMTLPGAFARDELYIRCEDQTAVLAGSEHSGALHAVYEVLERNGVRFYGPGERGELVPRRDALVIAQGEVRDRPFFDVRFVQPAAPSPGGREEINTWSRRNRNFVGRYSAAHRMVSPHLAEILPEALFADHPEYFGMDVHGQRNPPSRNSLNPCTSNPAVVRAIQDEAVRLLREKPEAQWFGIEPIDGGGWCQCPDCRALDAVAENYTDRVCVLANQIGEAVETAFPGEGRGARFFAYQGYMYPPVRTVLRDNVQVQLTRGYPEMLAAWSEKCSNLQRWDYNGWKTFKWGPMPLSSLVQKARLLHEHGFAAGWTDEEVSSLLFLGQPFLWVEMKLMWDPTRDVHELLDDFFTGYYGAAAAPMRRCFDLLEEETTTNQSSAEVFVEHQNGIRFKPVNYAPRVWRRCLEWVEEAETLVADDPWALRHVRVARMTYLLADVARDAQMAKEFVEEPEHEFWSWLTSRSEENQLKLRAAIGLILELGPSEVRGNAEPAMPEAMLAMWGPLLRISINPFRDLFELPPLAPEDERPWTVALEDHFERDELGEEWVVTDGDWRIVDGHVTGRGCGLFAARELPGDVRLEFEAWVDPGQTVCDLDGLLSVARLAKWRGGDGYLFQFGGWGNTVNNLFKGKTRVFSSKQPMIEAGRRHRVACERSGQRLRWWIDGRLVVDYEDPFEPLAGGHVGFLIDTVGQIDNVRVLTR